MVRLPEFDPIAFLIHRKFGAAAKSEPLGALSAGLSATRLARKDPELASRIEKFSADLRRLPPDQLNALVQEEQKKQNEELRARLEKEEQERFFNQPYAQADFNHWSKAAHWTLDEAIALSFGRAPEVVTWQKVMPCLNISAFAKQYQRRRDLALRAVAWQQLFDPVLPGIFLAWAERIDEPVPPKLVAAVKARGIQIADWKKLYDDLLASREENHKKWMEICNGQTALIEELKRRIDDLENCPATTEDAATTASEKSLSTRERDSLLKLIIGMAMCGYAYDPEQKRNDKLAEIVGDLERAGVSLDADTVRKWLREAAELLPPKQTE